MAAEAAKQRLWENARNKSLKMKHGIDWILKSEPDALHANNLQRMLTKHWSEYLGSHIKIESKIP